MAAFQRIQAAYEVLKDPQERAKYDEALRSTQQRADVPISLELDLDDMNEEGPSGRLSFSHGCRCGGRFQVQESDLSETSDHVLVQCNVCSLFARIHYTVAS